MNSYYLLIFLGFYGVLILLLIIIRQIIVRVKIPRRSRNIVFVFGVLFAFLVCDQLRKPWYNVFKETCVISAKGELVGALHNFEIAGIIDIEAGDLITSGEYEKIKNHPQMDTLEKELNKKGPDAGETSMIRVLNVKDHLDRSFKVLPVLILAFLINSLLNYFLFDGLWVDEEGEPLVPNLLRQLASIFIYLVAVTVVVAIIFPGLIAGFLTTVGTSGAVAVFLGQQPIKQAFTALSLNITKRIRKGDMLELDGFVGRVQEIGWKSIKLQTREQNILSIPNTILVNSVYINYSQPDALRTANMEVPVRNSIAPDRIIRLLSRAAQDSKLTVGKPMISLLEVRNFRSIYGIEVDTFDLDIEKVKSEVLSSVWYMLRREKIHLHSEQDDLENPAEMAKKLLNNVPILEPFNEEEDNYIAQRVDWLRYGYPERVVIEGEVDASLFVVASGNLEVLIRQDNGEDLQVATIGKNAIFGEKALLTGEPRGASVRALEEVLLCRISKETIRPILYKRKNILEILSQKMAEKELLNRKKEEEYENELEQQQKKSTANRLLNLMQNFFKEDEEGGDDNKNANQEIKDRI